VEGFEEMVVCDKENYSSHHKMDHASLAANFVVDRVEATNVVVA
jgi:hypothetical protein